MIFPSVLRTRQAPTHLQWHCREAALLTRCPSKHSLMKCPLLSAAQAVSHRAGACGGRPSRPCRNLSTCQLSLGKAEDEGLPGSSTGGVGAPSRSVVPRPQPAGTLSSAREEGHLCGSHLQPCSQGRGRGNSINPHFVPAHTKPLYGGSRAGRGAVCLAVARHWHHGVTWHSTSTGPRAAPAAARAPSCPCPEGPAPSSAPCLQPTGTAGTAPARQAHLLWPLQHGQALPHQAVTGQND